MADAIPNAITHEEDGTRCECAMVPTRCRRCDVVDVETPVCALERAVCARCAARGGH